MSWRDGEKVSYQSGVCLGNVMILCDVASVRSASFIAADFQEPWISSSPGIRAPKEWVSSREWIDFFARRSAIDDRFDWKGLAGFSFADALTQCCCFEVISLEGSLRARTKSRYKRSLQPSLGRAYRKPSRGVPSGWSQSQSVGNRPVHTKSLEWPGLSSSLGPWVMRQLVLDPFFWLSMKWNTCSLV
jgi:hypothetical protein